MILYHYTDEAGLRGILASGTINPSTAAQNPRDVRHGDGQYLSDIEPGTRTPSQLSRDFLGFPFLGRRFTHFVAIDADGFDIIEGRPGVIVIPNDGPLDIAGRVISAGPTPTSSNP